MRISEIDVATVLVAAFPFAIMGWFLPLKFDLYLDLVYAAVSVATGVLRFGDIVRTARDVRLAKSPTERVRANIRIQYQEVKLHIHIRTALLMLGMLGVATLVAWLRIR